MYHHSRVVFGVTCSPFLLGSVINKHLENTLRDVTESNTNVSYRESTVKKLKNSFYVDNCITSVPSTDELNVFVKESTQIFSDAKFELRGWTYTCDEIPRETVAVLGLNWCPSEDVLSLRPELLNLKDLPKVTKRAILSITHSLFDPIGFSAPVALFPKLLLQETWSMKLGWDDEVNEDIKSRFLGWYSQLDVLKDVKISRWLAGQSIDVTGWTLHIFCDASKLAYAACIFLRIESENETTVRLVQAKSRVAPTKNMTIPRLELMAALIGARLADMVSNAMKPINIPCCFWSDSSTVISWIKRSSQWNVFVRNRVNEIIQLTDKKDWRHVAGIDNPADILSRGCSPRKLMKLKWWEGPTWLCYPEEDWPQSQFVCDENEIQQERLKTIHSTLITSNEKKENDWYYKHFSKFNQVVRLVTWIQRFVKNCKAKETKQKGDLSVEELEQGRNLVMKLIQRDSFEGNSDKSLKSLKVMKDKNGIIRVETKLVQRSDAYDFKYPVVLPEKHPVVRRLIYETHKQNCHVGAQGLLSLLREDYWILRGRKAVSSVVRKCVVCQRFDGKVLESIPASLPENRVREAAVFEITGLDFAGPIYLKEKTKAWICLFTCAVFRAVHFELVASLSASDFLLALRRFISRRGRPQVIYSDNATNFTATESAIKKLDWEKINTNCTSMKIQWIFIPPSAPWWGGWWERLIRILKGLFKKVLGKSSLNYEEVVTVLCDCEAVVNSRPLTYLSENPNDLMPLTPSCFLQEIRDFGTPDIDNLENTNFERRFKHRQDVLKSLRKRFRNEYLGQLTTFSKTKVKKNNLKVGDVVLVTSENKSRLEWPIAVIEKLIPGRDQVVRLVELKTSKGTLIRPVQKLCLLETIDWKKHEPREETRTRPKRTIKVPTRFL